VKRRNEKRPPSSKDKRPIRPADARRKKASEAKHARMKEHKKASPRRSFPTVTPGPEAPPRVGEWLLTTRPGAEQDLIEELVFTDSKSEPHVAGPSLVATLRLPHSHGHPVEMAFARQGFPISHVGVPDNQTLSNALTLGLRKLGAPQPWALDAWVPDADPTNPLANSLDKLQLVVPPEWEARRVKDSRKALADNGLYAQVCLVSRNMAALGVLPARDAPSLAPGGRLRVHVADAAPSRAAMKLVESFAWLDRAPEPGDVCVDLGAAPGGWSWVLLDRGAKVYAVDPAVLKLTHKNLTHLRADAFHFDPGEPVDWLCSDMAWRPLEAAALLGKWARRGWARFMVANIKLPMKKKAEHVFRVRDILTDGGWTSVRARQLYHDRDEVTFAAVRI
jgi:23S rRNA (cytidine2498-2'-O)-methyltransferase